jgi:Fe-S oxidoreductase
MYFRMGLYEQMEQIAQRVTHYLRDQLQVNKIWTLCIGDLDVLQHTLPQFGADLSGIDVDNYQKVILQKLESGELPIVQPLSGTVAIQDSCHGRTMDPSIFELPRKLLQLIGLEVMEPPYSKEAQICCGIACGFSHKSAYSKMRLMKGTGRALKNMKAAKSKYICADCSGCLQSLGFAQKMTLSCPPIYHILELIQLAIGEPLRQRHKEMGSQLFMGALSHQKGGRLVKIPPIPLEPP